MGNAAFVVLVAACLLALGEVCRAQLCSQCECLPEPEDKLLCARQEHTGKYRGFRSRCELDCSNRCRKNKYVFVAEGRCGKYLASLTSTTTTTSTAAPVPALPGAVHSSVFGPLLQLLMGAVPTT